ncbi:MAG: hypothetical protein ACI8W3_003820 [Myxococcota bacterium]|jgi:hypothetical protein
MDSFPAASDWRTMDKDGESHDSGSHDDNGGNTFRGR